MDGGRPVVKRVLRSASNSLKRKSTITAATEKVKLAKILGLTVSNNAALDTDWNSGTIAYPAGCVVVLYNSKRNKQNHIFNTSKKTITTVAFSRDGKYLVTGECGHQPAVRVWDLEDYSQIAEFQGHKFGINCVSFSPNLKYIISVGTQHDMVINVWSWKANSKLASNKVANNVQDMDFSEDGSYFVTVGNRHVKFWYLDASKSRATVNETVPLMGRAGILGEQKNNWFCGVACGKGCMSSKTFVITQGGLLCEFNDKRLLDKWVELRTSRASAIVVSEKYIYIGCADGLVRIFSCLTLHYIASLPRPHHLGIDVSVGLDPSHILGPPPDAKYPDTIAISFDEEAQKMTCIYSDHSMYIWDVRDIKRVGKSKSFLYHSACIWGLDVYPDVAEKRTLPEGSFITCSSDTTIRVWNVNPGMDTDTNYKRNIYSNELLKIVYTDSDLSTLTDLNTGGKSGDKGENDKVGVRSVRVSPDGQLLASGDRQGNIRVHKLRHMEQIQELEAHNSDILDLEFTPPNCGVNLLATASRDRLIHVFDLDQDFGLIQTLDDHSAAITAVKFTQHDHSLNMLSCGADKSLLFRNAQLDPEFQFVLDKHLVSKTTFYDMDVDPTQKFVATACQDRNIRIYNQKNSKQKKCYPGSLGSDGTLIRVGLDASGSYVLTSCSDKNLCIVDFFTGELLATMCGHSEVVTGLKVMNDLKHVISVGGDGCIFIWRLPINLTEQAQSRLLELKEKSKLSNGDLPDGEWSVASEVSTKDLSPDAPKAGPVLDNNANIPETNPDYSFNVGQLPTWAKKQVLQDPSKTPGGQPLNAQAPRGKWAQRVENKPVSIKSVMDDSNINLCLADCMGNESSPRPKNLDKRRYTVEPETLKNQVDLANLRRETMIVTAGRKPNVPIITDDDVDNVDEEEDDDFKPPTEGEHGHKHESRMSVFHPSLHVTGSSELEDREEENAVIYYPNTDQEPGSPDIEGTSFQVYEGDATSVKDFARKHRHQSVGGKSEGSEGTEPTSVEDTSDDESNASTPLENKGFVTPDQEKFMKDHFESMALKESFNTTLTDLDTEITGGHVLHADDSFTRRLSISTRFLSRAQQQHIRQGIGHSTPISAAQRKREDVTKAVEDTRKRLHNLGWRPGGDMEPESVFNRQPPTPSTPTKNGDTPRTRSTSARRKPEPGSERRKTIGDVRPDSPPRLSKPPPSPSLTPERRRWMSSSPSSVEDPVTGSGGMRRWQSMLDMAGGRTTPTTTTTSSKVKATPRSKTPLSYSLSQGRTLPQTPTSSRYVRTNNKKPRKSAGHCKRIRRTSSPVKSLSHIPRSVSTKMEIKLDSNSSASGGSGLSGSRPADRSASRARSEKNIPSAVADAAEINRRRSSKPSYMQHTSSSNSKLAKSGSTSGLNKAVPDPVPVAAAPSGPPPKVPTSSSSSRRSAGPVKKGRLSASLKSKFQSTPNLAELSVKDDDSDSLSQVMDDMGKLGASPERSMSAFKSPIKRDNMPAAREPKDPYLNGGDTSHELVSNTREEKPEQKEFKDAPVKSVWKRIAPEFKVEHIAHEQREGEPEDSFMNDSVQSQAKEIEDSLAMPPPATTEVPSSRLAQITHDARSTPTEITLDQAKDILLGKSNAKSDTSSSSFSSMSKNTHQNSAEVPSKSNKPGAPPVNMSSYPSAPWRSVYSSTTATSPPTTSSTATTVSVAKSGGGGGVQYGTSSLAVSDLDETPVKDDSAPTRDRSVNDGHKASRIQQASSPSLQLTPRSIGGGASAFVSTTATTSVFREPVSSSRSEKLDSTSRREGEPDDLPLPARPRSATGGGALSARSSASGRDSVSREANQGYNGLALGDETLEPADCGDITLDNDTSVPVEPVFSPNSAGGGGEKPKVTVLSRNRENILNSLFSTSNKNPTSGGATVPASSSTLPSVSVAKPETVNHSRSSSMQSDTSEQEQQSPNSRNTHQVSPAATSTKTLRSGLNVPPSPSLSTTPRASPRRRVPTTPSSPAAITARSQWEQTFKDHKLRKQQQQLQQMDLQQGHKHLSNPAKVTAEKDEGTRGPASSISTGNILVPEKAGGETVPVLRGSPVNTNANTAGQSKGNERTSSVTPAETVINGIPPNTNKKPNLHLTLQNVNQPSLPNTEANGHQMNHTETPSDQLDKAMKELTKSSDTVLLLLSQVESGDERKVQALKQITTLCDRLYSAVGVADSETATTLNLVDRVCKLLEHKLPSLTPTETHL